MTMRFAPNQSIAQSGTDNTLQAIYLWLDFMRTPPPNGPGWTVPISADGSTVDTGGLGANITGYTDLTGSNQSSWFVLRSPDGAHEIEWHGPTTQDQFWGGIRSPSAGFTGGSIGSVPTAPDGVSMFSFVGITQGNSMTIHMGADDAAPYAFWVWCNTAGNFAADAGGWGMIPISDGAQPGETDPYVFFTAEGSQNLAWRESVMDNQTADANSGRPWGYVPPAGNYQALSSMAPLHLGVLGPDANGDDPSFPILWGRSDAVANAGFKGISDFVQWNGVTRTPGSTFNSNTRISIGDVNVPWDGVTTPTA